MGISCFLGITPYETKQMLDPCEPRIGACLPECPEPGILQWSVRKRGARRSSRRE